MKRVAIFGCGPGGGTVAHELSKFSDYKIDIYEKNNKIGGLARSDRDDDGCASEISWRVFFDFYHNIFKVFREIPLINDKNKTVLNNLTIYHHTNIFDSKFSNKDKLIGLYYILYGFMSCDKRLDDLDNLSWWEALKSTSKSNLYREIGGWLGMDRKKGSYKSVIKVGLEMQILDSYLSKNYKDWITTKPTSEAWFDHWKVHLEKQKVKFHMNTELKSVEIENNKIISALIYDLNNKSYHKIIADYYVFSIPVQEFSQIIDIQPKLNYGELKNIKKLKETCLHMQLAFQVYFNQPVSLGILNKNKKYNAFLVVDSPWDLIVLSYDAIYEDTKLCNKLQNVKGGWSITVCTAYIDGIVFKKSFKKCSYDEIIIEIWAQLKNSPSLKKLVSDNNSFELDDNLVVKWTPMWSTFNYDKNSQTLQNSEPKFTNNIGSYALRPSFKTHIDNLFIATAYIKETIDIFSMEAACIAGKRVSNAINEKSDKPIIQRRPLLFLPFRTIDNLFYNIGMPNMGFNLIIFLLLIILVMIYFVIKYILTKNIK